MLKVTIFLSDNTRKKVVCFPRNSSVDAAFQAAKLLYPDWDQIDVSVTNNSKETTDN